MTYYPDPSSDFKLSQQKFKPWFFLAAFLLLTLVMAMSVRAEENCGVSVLTTARVSGVIKAVTPLTGWSGAIVASDAVDPRYVVSVSVNSVEPDDKRNVVLTKVKKNTTLNFAIHSPALFFVVTPSGGESIQLQVEAMVCDGVFRRFTRVISRPSSIPEQFSGNLEVGTTYNANVEWSESGAIELTIPIKVPYHHIYAVDWDNPEDLPKRDPDLRTQAVVFKVESREIRRKAERLCATVYKCKVKRSTR